MEQSPPVTMGKGGLPEQVTNQCVLHSVHDLDSIVLVTHAVHLRRGLLCHERLEVDVVGQCILCSRNVPEPLQFAVQTGRLDNRVLRLRLPCEVRAGLRLSLGEIDEVAGFD